MNNNNNVNFSIELKKAFPVGPGAISAVFKCSLTHKYDLHVFRQQRTVKDSEIMDKLC